jgi:hypothetical protein
MSSLNLFVLQTHPDNQHQRRKCILTDIKVCQALTYLYYKHILIDGYVYNF